MSPPFRGTIASYIFETHNVTSTCQNNLVWQTKQQRNVHDMAHKVRHYENYNSRRWEREEEIRRKPNDDERFHKYESNRYSRCDDLRKKLDSINRKKKNENNLTGTRSRSYSRVRCEQSRGRSRSPRSPGVPGPSILKQRSQSAHGRGLGGDTIVTGKTWKRFRISDVDQVLEFSPSPEVVDDGGRVCSQQEMGEYMSESDNDAPSVRDSTPSTKTTSPFKKSLKFKNKVSNKKTNDDTKSMNTSTKGKKSRSIKVTKTHADEGTLVSETDGNNISEDATLLLQPDQSIYPVDNIEQSNADSMGNTGLLNVEDSGVEAHEKTKADFTESEVCNWNDLSEDEDFHGFDSKDIGENFLSNEEDTHGYEMEDLDLIDDDNNDIRVQDLNRDDDQKWEGELTILFSGDYHTRQVPCQYQDCPIKSTPSTIGLLPFITKPGHEWHCPDHTRCLLCSDLVDNTNSVMCVMCARVFHTCHLQDLGIEEEDMKELVCKLCSDPEQFTPAQKKGCMDSTGIQKSGLAKITKTNPTATTTGYLTKCGTNTKKEIMTTDHSLPSGWSRLIVMNSVNRKRVVIIGPDARKYWSRRDLEKAFKYKNEGVEWQFFSFSLYTSTKKQEIDKRI